MIKGIIGKKLGMTQVFNENGDVVPVTLIQVGPCYIVQKKFKDRDGYDALQTRIRPEEGIARQQAG